MIYKNKPKFWIVILIAATLFTGCSTTFKSPTDLIQKPKLDINEKAAKEVIYKYLPKTAKLIRPLSPGTLSSVSYLNLDKKANQTGYYAFYKNIENETIGFLILKKDKDNNFTVFSLKEIPADDISYAEFIDINKDGKNDLIIGTESKDMTYKKVYLYLSAGNEYKEFWTNNYTDLIVTDLNNDKKTDIFCLSLDRNTCANAKVYNIFEDKMVKVDEIEMDQDIKAYYNVKSGKVNYNTKGIFIDFSMGLRSATNILFFKDNKLNLAINPFAKGQNYSSTLKNTRLKSQDINNDRIIEIPVNYNAIQSNSKIENNRLYAWYSFNTKSKSYEMQAMSYQNNDNTYKIQFPKLWINLIKNKRMTVISSLKKSEQDYVKLYYINDKNNNNLNWLLTYEIMADNDFEKWKSDKVNNCYNHIELAKKDGKTIIVYYLKNIDKIDKECIDEYKLALLNKFTLQKSIELLK